MQQCHLYVWTSPNVWIPLYVLVMFGCILYIHNTKKACFDRLRVCPYAPIHLDAPCIFRWPPYVWTPPHVWMPPVCLDIPHMFGHHHMFGCPLYVWMMFWMLTVLIEHKKIMLCQTKGVSICCPYIWRPPHVWMPFYVFMSPVCLDTTHMFVCHPLCLDMPPVCLDTPICLDAPCMFGCPHMFGCNHCMFGCPICFDAPTVCLAAPICLDGPLYVWIPQYVWIPPYVWMPTCIYG